LPQIAAGHAYEGHQKARTFASRYMKAEQYDTAVDVLFQSAREMLKAGHQGSGIDLASFLVDAYDAKDEVITEESLGRLTQLIALTGPDGKWRKVLIDKSSSWTVKAGKCPAGEPDLNHYVGELLFKEGALDAAEPYLLAAGKRDSARTLAQLYHQWLHLPNNREAVGAFACRGTLPYLLNGNIAAARNFLTQYIGLLLASLPSLKSPLQPTPIPLDIASQSEKDEIVVTTESVLNFLQLAVRACQRSQGDRNKPIRESWIRLCGTYQSKGGLLAKPEVRRVLTELATLYFGFPPPRGQGANPLGDVLSSLFGGAPAGPAKPRVLAPGIPTPAAGLD